MHISARSTALLKAVFHVPLLDFEHLPLQRSLHGPDKDRFSPTSFSSAFPTFSQQLYQEQACSAVSDTGQRAWKEEERRAVESVKCLIGTRNGGSHLTYPNVCAHHECRIREHFLIKRKFGPRDFFGQVKSVHGGFHLDLNKKRHDIVEPDVLVLSKKFLNSKIFLCFLKNSLLLTKPVFI